MDKGLELNVRRRAGSLCEYCQLPESASTLKHVIDHVIARQHGGETSLANLVLCCGRCNAYKGPNIAGIDPLTNQISRLFHPRTDKWADHFRWDGPLLIGSSPIGRATIAVLSINKPARVTARRTLISVGKFPSVKT